MKAREASEIKTDLARGAGHAGGFGIFFLLLLLGGFPCGAQTAQSGEIRLPVLSNSLDGRVVGAPEDAFLPVWKPIESNNGEVSYVDMKSIERGAAGMQVQVYTSVPNTIFDLDKLKVLAFDCQGHFMPFDDEGMTALQNRPETWFTPWRRTVGFPSFGLTHEDAFMPWKETRTVDQRLQFLSSYQKEEMSVTDLCHEYGISRPTAYKWIKRYDEVGPEGLLDLTRTPHSSPYATSAEIENEVLALRKRFPSWGARKLKARLERMNPNVSWPAASTVGQILSRAGLTNPKRKKRRATPSSQPFSMVTAPNQLWCMDFKGYFLTGDGYRCDPFTITDAHSRFLIRCQAVATHGSSPSQRRLRCRDARVRRAGTHPHRQRSTIRRRRPAGSVEVVAGNGWMLRQGLSRAKSLRPLASIKAHKGQRNPTQCSRSPPPTGVSASCSTPSRSSSRSRLT